MKLRVLGNSPEQQSSARGIEGPLRCSLIAWRSAGRQARPVITTESTEVRHQTFETAIIERYQRRENSVEEALIEMYLAGVSVRRVEDITEAFGARGYRPRRCQT